MITIHFEDHGQDFLEWDIENGEVIACRPFQEWLWKGTKVINDDFPIGGVMEIEQYPDPDPKGTQIIAIKYPIEKVDYHDGSKQTHRSPEISSGNETQAP